MKKGNNRLIYKDYIQKEAKITPIKIGQFVSIWKRNKDGLTKPYDKEDDINGILIGTSNDTFSGFFVFPKNVLLEKNILSIKGKGGKRGIRVYPP